MPAAPAPTTLPSFGPDAQCPVPDASFPAWYPRALHLLSLPNHSLLDVAEALAIPLHQLARFVLSREGLEAATDIQAASIIHARTAAAASLPKVVSLLSQSLDDFLKSSTTERATPEPNTPDATTLSPAKPAAPTTPTVEARHHRALRAAHLLVRLANFQPKPLQRLFATTTPPTDNPAPQSPRLQPGHNHHALIEHAVTLPTCEHAIPDAPWSSAPPTRASPALDAPWASGRCEGRSEALRASPSTDQTLPSPPLGRTNKQQQPANPSTTSAAPLTTGTDTVNIARSSSASLMPDAQCPMPSPPPLPSPHSPLPSLHPP